MKRVCSLVMAMVLCLGVLFLAGCGKKEEEPTESFTKTTHTTAKLLNIEIPITHIEIESAMGFEVEKPTVINDGQSVFTRSVDGKVSINISMTEQTADQFSQSVSKIPGVKEAPNLGEKAYWKWEKGNGALFVLNKGYGISCTVIGTGISEDTALIDSRAIVATIIGKM